MRNQYKQRMKSKHIVLIVILLQASISFSQNNSKSSFFILKGTVIDSISGESVPFSTISVSKSKMPAAPFKRVAADANGKFELEANSTDTLLLKFDAVGMKSTTVPVSNFSTKVIDMGNILLPPNDKMLSEVTVVAQKPLVKVDLDKITYDMKSDPESETSNILDMLRKVPMVTVDGDENIQVKGQSRFKIFMNGKETTMLTTNPAQVLKSIPASTVKNIEVITEPGAKYEAEGLAGIINIVTESAVKGYTGTVRANVDNYGALGGGLYFSTKIGKWGITTNLNQSMFKEPKSSSDLKRESFNSTDYKFLNNQATSNNFGNFRYGNLSVSYEMDSLNLLTLTGNGWGGGFTSKSNGTTSMLSDALDTVQMYTNSSEMQGVWGGYDGSLDYQRSFKKPDKLLTSSYKISHGPRNFNNENGITNVTNYFDSKQRIITNASGTEHTFQVDYTEPFNKKHIIELGTKYIYRINQSDNEYLLYNFSNDAWESMPDITDRGIYHTHGILGAYGSYTYRMKKFSARAGGRFEHTNASIQYNNGNSFTHKPFNNLVPSVTLSYQTTPGSNLQFSYTQRISRPDISYLNPFKNISDPKNIQQGNPDLLPEISNSFNVNYNLFTQKFNFNSSLFTSFANNTIEQISTLQDTIVYSTYANIGKKRNTGTSVYFRWQVTKDFNWYFNGNGSYSYYFYELDNRKIENDGFNYGAFLGASYSLPKDFRINLNGGYHSPSISLQSRGYGFYYYSLSLNKALLQKKLNISINANGFFEKFISFRNEVITESFKTENIYTRQSPRIRLSVSYTFGQMKEQIKKVERGIENDDVKSGGGQAEGGQGVGTQQVSGQ